MKATDLNLIHSVGAPTLDPNGSRAVVSVTRPDIDGDSTVGQLWSVPLDGARPRRATRGVHDTSPQFSPDGSLIAFLRVTGDGAPQLHVVTAGGGEPVAVTDRHLGVSEFAWSPDGARFAFISREPEQGRYGTVKGLAAGAEPARRLTRLRYTANGLGYIVDRPAQVFVVDVPDVEAEPPVAAAPKVSDGAESPEEVSPLPQARQLTHGSHDHGAVVFTPDGQSVVFVVDRDPESNDDLRGDVISLDIGSDDARGAALTTTLNLSGLASPVFAPDGALFFLAQDVGETGTDFVARNSALYLIEKPGSVALRVTDPESIDLTESEIVLSPADGTALVRNRSRGTMQLLSIDRTGEVATVADGAVEVTRIAASADAVVVAFTDPGTSGDLAIVTGDGLHPLTDFSEPLRAAGIAEQIEFTATARDGYPVHGWVVIPSGEGPHPVLLNIHGGPYSQHSVSVFDEAQVYADAGYVVVQCNPRGSAGYGQAHGRVIRQAMGTIDETDVLDFLDAAVEAHSQLDGDRVGIMGGSYGGYLTAWTISNDHRFAAAIVERGFLDPEAFIGTSDIGTFFGDEYVGTDAELIRSQSPQAAVGGVRTPTLVLHSENDLRCPVSQAERYFASLRRGGVESEMVLFPGENHELSRGGRPRHRLQRFEVILEWWARHLPSERNRAE